MEFCDFFSTQYVMFLNYVLFPLYCFQNQILFKIKMNLIRIKWQEWYEEEILSVLWFYPAIVTSWTSANPSEESVSTTELLQVPVPIVLGRN